jgi:hypothetical protein
VQKISTKDEKKDFFETIRCRISLDVILKKGSADNV